MQRFTIIKTWISTINTLHGVYGTSTESEYRLIIREASKDEIELVRMIIYDAFKEYIGVLHPPSGALRETVEGIRKKIEGRGGALIVWDESVPIGSALYYYENDYMYIGRVSVLPSYRGRGIAKAMIRYLEDLAKGKGYLKTRVEVRLSLPENLEYYTKLKYIPIEEHEYPDKTDKWYTMSKNLLEFDQDYNKKEIVQWT